METAYLTPPPTPPQQDQDSPEYYSQYSIEVTDDIFQCTTCGTLGISGESCNVCNPQF